MRRIYYYGFLTRIISNLFSVCLFGASLYCFYDKPDFEIEGIEINYILVGILWLLMGVAFVHLTYGSGIFVNYKKNKLKISLPTALTHVYTADEVHTVNIHKESNGYIFTVVFKNGKREEILNRTFARTHFIDSIQYDRLRDELGRFIVTANKEEEISDEEN